MTIDQMTIATMFITISGYISMKALGKLFKID